MRDKNILIWRNWFKDESQFEELIKEFNFTEDIDGIIFLALRTYDSAVGYHPKWKKGHGWMLEEDEK